jgi:multidrug resistance efflux pump
MIQRYILPLLAVATFLFAIYHVIGAEKEPPAAASTMAGVRPNFDRTVAGAGIIEAQTENISIGSQLPGIVQEVFVKVNQKVKTGDPLFRLDDRHLRADLAVRKANLLAAQTELAKLEAMPRPEELPAAEARVREAEANLTEAEDKYRRSEPLLPRGAITEGELVRYRQAVAAARAQVARAKADYELLTAGAWEADKAVARAQIEQSKAQMQQVETDIARMLVTAPMDAEVLQSNVHPGEYVAAPASRALIVLGNVHRFHVRVDIDEHDIPRFTPGASAVAYLRGYPEKKYPLRFVRVEPYVIPKRSLTGDNTERVDTRVLQVLFALDPQGAPLYVGQQMDVEIEVTEPAPPQAAPGQAASPKRKKTGG